MPSVYLGVHLPFKPYQKLKIEDVDLGGRTDMLWCQAFRLIKSDVAPQEFEFIYCGTPLRADDVLQNKGVTDGAMIHVIHKRRENDPSVDEVQPQEERHLTEAEVQKVLCLWRMVDSSNFQKVRQPEFMKKVLDAYPSIRRNLYVLSLLKDPILLSSMQQPETIRRVALKHPVLIEASRTIVQLLNSKMISKVANCHLSAPLDSALDDPLSDSSSSDENTASPTTSTAPATIRRITADQLASALAFAGTGGSYNSLSNISQRDADNRASQQDGSAESPTTASSTAVNLPSTSASQPSTSAGPAATSSGDRITSSMLFDAISMMFQQQRSGEGSTSAGTSSARASTAAVASDGGEATANQTATVDEPMDTTPTPAAPAAPMGGDLGVQTQSQHTAMAASIGQYRSELELMREMGLTDTETNLQALIVCNGNVESAVNLVLSGMSN
ncbi:pneumococcal serine-rich repeat protein [Anopheles ziemanni]|uniref:pneumococcal serine-rich repeat protein n=1 Tax=Anopheles coustani TaxID=139045 RepID=UPI002658B164|nr:pneumococcal serine-rich repeat protein [Anopheles coustani]XP_058172058.1 pneumococcal serine-rich repeat protein [Anopheles ziemanni]